MKVVRVLLLVLFAVLLPLRGALAEASHCAGAAAHALGAATTHDHDDGHTHGGDAHASHALSAGDEPAGSEASNPADACNLCSASCASPPILTSLQPLVHAPLAAAGPRPAKVAPPPSHVPDGQERPPRHL